MDVSVHLFISCMLWKANDSQPPVGNSYPQQNPEYTIPTQTDPIANVLTENVIKSKMIEIQRW